MQSIHPVGRRWLMVSTCKGSGGYWVNIFNAIQNIGGKIQVKALVDGQHRERASCGRRTVWASDNTESNYTVTNLP